VASIPSLYLTQKPASIGAGLENDILKVNILKPLSPSKSTTLLSILIVEGSLIFPSIQLAPSL